jgi:hypothetical protein
MPKGENEPVSADEWLFRRVRIELFRTAKLPLISPSAFEPRTKGRDIDHDGISLFRAACLDDPREVISHLPAATQRENGVVRIPVAKLFELGIAIDVKPIGDCRGHVVLRELNAESVRLRRDWLRETAFALAQIASEEGNIILRPETE